MSKFLDKLIVSAPYIILALAIWRMTAIRDDSEVDLAAGLQSLFLALAAIFLKIDIRDRITKREERSDTDT